MKDKIPLELEGLLNCFPEIAPPIILSQEVVHRFSKQNKPLSQQDLTNFFSKWEDFDDITEIVPCCRIKSKEGFLILVYWKASLLKHEYKLLTLSKQAEHISLKVIGGLNSNGDSILQSVATIDDDLCIYTVVGLANKEGQLLSEQQAWKFQILPDGLIHSEKESITK